MSERALALVPNPNAAAKRKRAGDNDGDNDALLAPGSVSDPSLALVVPATGGPAITKAEYEKRLKDVRGAVFSTFDSVVVDLPPLSLSLSLSSSPSLSQPRPPSAGALSLSLSLPLSLPLSPPPSTSPLSQPRKLANSSAGSKPRNSPTGRRARAETGVHHAERPDDRVQRAGVGRRRRERDVPHVRQRAQAGGGEGGEDGEGGAGEGREGGDGGGDFFFERERGEGGGGGERDPWRRDSRSSGKNGNSPVCFVAS